MSFKVKDLVIIKDPFWFQGQNYGDMLAEIIRIESYIYVELRNKEKTELKCFQYELDPLVESTEEDEINKAVNDLFGDYG
jgi:hypothetical protein